MSCNEFKFCSKENCCHVAIIGAGPVGLFASSMCEMLGLRSVVFDILPEIGGQCGILYPEKNVYGIPAFSNIKSKDLISNLYEQALYHNVSFKLSTCVENVEQDGDCFKIQTDRGFYYSKSVIISAGMGAFTPNKPDLENIENLEGNSVHYHVCDPEIFTDKKVVIAGGGDSAIDWCVELSKIAASVSLIHRREAFRCSDFNKQRLNEVIDNGKADVYKSSQLAKLNFDGKNLKSLIIKDKDCLENEITADHLIVLFGVTSNLGKISNWDLEFEKQKIIVDKVSMQTSKCGIFAIGDCVCYENKVKIITAGFGEAITAAYSVKRFLYPNLTLQNDSNALGN